MFPPKQKTHEDFVDFVKVFVTAHGRVPERRDELESGRKLYANLQKNKKLDILQPYLMERGVLFAVDVFYTQHERLPKRQHRTASEEAKMEDTLAHRWHRVLQRYQDGELAASVIDHYLHLFEVATKLDAEQVENVCRAVDIFLHDKEHLPRCQDRNASEEAKREDNLARRWHRVLKCREDGELAAGVVDSYWHLFEAQANLDAVENVCKDVQVFVEQHGRLPERQPYQAGVEKIEDKLARRWCRALLKKEDWDAGVLCRFRPLVLAAHDDAVWKSWFQKGLETFLATVTVLELFVACCSLTEEDVQRHVAGAKVLLADFKASCLDVLFALCVDGASFQLLAEGDAVIDPVSSFKVVELDGRIGLQFTGSEKMAGSSLVCWRHDAYRVVLSQVVAFVSEHGRWPCNSKGSREESQMMVVVQQVRSRQQGPVSKFYRKALHAYARCLSEEQMVAWESIGHGSVFMWNPGHRQIFEDVQTEFAGTGCLPMRGPRSPTDALAQRVRRVRLKTLETGRKKMRRAEQMYWEQHFPGIWERRQEKDVYVPDDMMVDASERREFSRAPVAIAMFACELCSFETDVKEELQLHWREEHFAKSEGQDVGMDVSRCEEEYRKRMTFLHQTTGRRAAVCKLFLFCLSDGWKWDVRFFFLKGRC